MPDGPSTRLRYSPPIRSQPGKWSLSSTTGNSHTGVSAAVDGSRAAPDAVVESELVWALTHPEVMLKPTKRTSARRAFVLIEIVPTTRNIHSAGVIASATQWCSSPFFRGISLRPVTNSGARNSQSGRRIGRRSGTRLFALPRKRADVCCRRIDLSLLQIAFKRWHIAFSIADDLLQFYVRVFLHVRRTQVRSVQALSNCCRSAVLAVARGASAVEQSLCTLSFGRCQSRDTVKHNTEHRHCNDPPAKGRALFRYPSNFHHPISLSFFSLREHLVCHFSERRWQP